MFTSSIESWREAILSLATQEGLSMEHVALLSNMLDEFEERIASKSPESSPLPVQSPSKRYKVTSHLGRGGMGNVTRIWDHKLGRHIARKQKLPQASRRKFIREARISARLQHPGIVPIYDMNLDDELAPAYTMGLIQGTTLKETVLGLKTQGSDAEERERHRLVLALRSVAETLNYAHSQGVVHLDIKPTNIMLGHFGEVFVVDWGLAKTLPHLSQQLQGQDGSMDEREARTVNPIEDLAAHAQSVEAWATGVSGSLTYMAPEQVHQHRGPSRACDVFALGGCLYFILMGEAPRVGERCAILQALIDGAETQPVMKPGLPEALTALARSALSWDPNARPTLSSFILGLTNWLNGSEKRKEAQVLVSQALSDRRRRQVLLEEAQSIGAKAKAFLEQFQSWDPAEKKEAGWALESEARRYENDADIAQAAMLRYLNSALQLDPDCQEAQALLADHHRVEHGAAQARGDKLASLEHEHALRAYGAKRHAAYLRAEGKISLETNPPGAAIALYRYEEEGRALVAKSMGSLGHSPLKGRVLPAGSYLLELSAKGCETVRYPVSLGWSETWSTQRPGSKAAAPIYLPRRGMLDENECYVPAGWFRSKYCQDPVWVDGFVIRKRPVTNEEYIPFLNECVARGQDPHTFRYVPRERGRSLMELGMANYLWDEERQTYMLTTDLEGHAWLPNFPVVSIPWHAALDFCKWLSKKDGKPWRLPYELEWEKAYRGVDARQNPWGNGFDASFACVEDSFSPESGSAVATVEDDVFPMDTSPYGVRGMAGNSSDWCADIWDAKGPKVSTGGLLEIPAEPELVQDPNPLRSRMIKGGHWFAKMRDLNRRLGLGEMGPVTTLGFRPIRSLSSEEAMHEYRLCDAEAAKR